MIKKKVITLCAGAIAIAAVSCNSDTVNNEPVPPMSCQVTGFSLGGDTKVLANLDSVFFSIDQLQLQIFNADSLPMGTDVTRLVPTITTASSSIVEIYEPRPGKTDSIHDYLEHPGDSINFANGPVKLRVVSLDGQSTCTYSIKVNVHTVVSDTLTWSRLERSSLPSQFNVVTDQATTHDGENFYCLTYYDGRYCMASATDPAGDWSYVTPAFGFAPLLHSLNATDDALFILADNGALMTSTDGGVNWRDTGSRWENIYGAYGSRLLGLQNAGGVRQIVTYPSTTVTTAPADFPVSGASQAVTYTFEMSDAPQTVIVGGRRADGKLSPDTWGYDGSTWVKLTKVPLPYALEEATVVPYFTVSLNKNNWKVSRQSMLLAMFGRRSDGVLNDTIYMSPDMGMHWEKADTLLQMQKALPGRVGAQGFVYKQTMQASRSAQRSWSNLASDFPHVARMNAILADPRRSGIKPATEWECPFIYVFGGRNAAGNTYNTLYRGVITRFTFKPLH